MTPELQQILTQLVVQAPAIAILLYQNYVLYRDSREQAKTDTQLVMQLTGQVAALQEQIRELTHSLAGPSQ